MSTEPACTAAPSCHPASPGAAPTAGTSTALGTATGSCTQPHQPYSSLFYPGASAAAALLVDQHHQPHHHPQLHHHNLQHHHQLGSHERLRQMARNPFDAQSRIPLPHPFGEYHFGCESSFIRRRNERERERVRFVNEGYEKLKETLPFENKDKRISKVEILKTAIRYIQHMENLLHSADQSPADQQQHQRHHQQTAADSRKRAPADQPSSSGTAASGSGLKRRPLAQELQLLQQEAQEKRLRHC